MITIEEAIKECFEGGPKEVPSGFVSLTQIYNRVSDKLGINANPTEVKNILEKIMPEENIYFDDNPKSRLYKVRGQTK